MGKNFAAALKKLRIKKKMTQEELIIYGHISHSTISQYEQGLKDPAAWRIACLEAKLGVPFCELYKKAYREIYNDMLDKQPERNKTK